MVTIASNFNNFSAIPDLQNVFNEFGTEFEHTENNIFRRKIPLQYALNAGTTWFITATTSTRKKDLE
jgi:hypothetical protein